MLTLMWWVILFGSGMYVQYKRDRSEKIVPRLRDEW